MRSSVEGITAVLEGAFRPDISRGHHRDEALNVVKPHMAFFGQKDAQ
jgi:pantothenate synthetase